MNKEVTQSHKQAINAHLRTYAANVINELKSSSYDQKDEIETAHALLNIAVTALELIGSRSYDAAEALAESINAHTCNRLSKIAEDVAENAHYSHDDGFVYDTPEITESIEVFHSTLQSEINKEEAFESYIEDALPETHECGECGVYYAGDDYCPTCEQMDFERTHAAGRI